MKTSHRGLVAALAVLTAVSGLVALPAPSSAAAHLTMSAHSGHLTTNWDAVTHDFPSVATPVCVPAADATNLTITVQHVAAGVTHVGAGALVHADEIDVVAGGANTRMTYQTVGTGAGTVSATGAISQVVHLSATLRNCAGTTVLCTFSMTGTLTGQSSGGDDTLNVGDTATVSGTSNGITTAIGCNNAFRAELLGQTITLSLNVTVVA